MLSIKKILFPTDFSACAEQAFSQAAYLAERYDAVLHVLHVAEPSLVLPPLDLTEADIAADLHLPQPEPAALPKKQRAGAGTLLNVEVPPLDGSVERAILAYAAQEAEALPLERTDQPLDLIVTERGVCRIKAR